MLEDTARTVAFRTPAHPANPAGWEIRWGHQLDARVIRAGITGEITDHKVVAYLAKYTTKSTEVTGGTVRPVTCRDCRGTGLAGACHTCSGTGLGADLGRLPVPAHVRALIAAAFELGGVHGDNVAGYQALRRWAHMLGFRGHTTTKSRRYSTTFRALRQTRQNWRRRHILARDHIDEETILIVGLLTYAGTGWHTPADAELARTAAALAREQRRVAHEELACA